MKAIDIKTKLIILDNKLRNLIKKEGSTNISKSVKQSKSDLTDYIRNRKHYSWEKILDIAEKLGL